MKIQNISLNKLINKLMVDEENFKLPLIISTYSDLMCLEEFLLQIKDIKLEFKSKFALFQNNYYELNNNQMGKEMDNNLNLLNSIPKPDLNESGLETQFAPIISRYIDRDIQNCDSIILFQSNSKHMEMRTNLISLSDGLDWENIKSIVIFNLENFDLKEFQNKNNYEIYFVKADFICNSNHQSEILPNFICKKLELH